MPDAPDLVVVELAWDDDDDGRTDYFVSNDPRYVVRAVATVTDQTTLDRYMGPQFKAFSI
jgi:hypothetical protein